ncbi:MAG: hypothetical protein EOP45_21305 [Sphingobacteriaceae bacterium]|nr:MAG: hypothetical protein EOP45_21305 [Sphingobacteriaceae bacterium]
MEPKKNPFKKWELKASLDNFYVPEEVHQKVFHNKIKEIEAVGLQIAPSMMKNLNVPEDTPIELLPCIYAGDSKRY